jgi:hypothetical protein
VRIRICGAAVAPEGIFFNYKRSWCSRADMFIICLDRTEVSDDRWGNWVRQSGRKLNDAYSRWFLSDVGNLMAPAWRQSGRPLPEWILQTVTAIRIRDHRVYFHGTCRRVRRKRGFPLSKIGLR